MLQQRQDGQWGNLGPRVLLAGRWQRLMPLGIVLDPRNPARGATFLSLSLHKEVAIPEPGEEDTLQVIAA